MSFNSNLRLWKLAVYAAVIASAAGIVGPIKTESVVAQPGLCEAPTGVTFKTIPAKALAAANKYISPAKVVVKSGKAKVNDIAGDAPNIIYELASRQKNGCPIEVDVFKSGKIDEAEYQLPSYNLVPRAARQAIARKVPGFTATLIEKSVRPAVSSEFKSKIVYEIEGTNAAGEAFEVDVNPKGTVLVVLKLEKTPTTATSSTPPTF